MIDDRINPDGNKSSVVNATQEETSQAKRNIEAIYPLSPMQQGMLFHSLYDNETSAYFEQFTCVLRGELNIEAFERAWQAVTNRQSVLRTSFVWKRLDKMLQVAQKEVHLPIKKYDWTTASVDEQKEKLESYLVADRAQGFDLSKPPLTRLALMRIASDRYYFVWSHHHALLDGWSVPLLLREVLTSYEAFCKGITPVLKPAKPYREYINWLQKLDMKAAETYWREVLKSFAAPTPLVVDRLSEDDRLVSSWGPQQDQRRELEIHLSKEATTKLVEMARRQRLTISTIFQAAWALLLSRYSGESDVMYGTIVSGRPPELAGAELMVGLFINTIPVRISLSPDELLAEWLQRFQSQLVQSRQFEHTPLVQIQEWSEIPRGFPMFESIVVFENYPVGESLQQQLGDNGKLRIEDIRSFEQTNYPLTVVSGPGEKLGIKISYDPGRFDDPVITRMLRHLQTILEGMVDDYEKPSFSERKLGDLQLLSPDEKKQMMQYWFGSPVVDPDQISAGWKSLTIVDLFEEQVKRTPESPALIYDSIFSIDNYPTQTLSFEELNVKMNKLAHYLQILEVGPETKVGVHIERSFEMIVAIFGILKAGGAYVPLDPNYPIDRIGFMIQDTEMPVILTQQKFLERLQASIADIGQEGKVKLIALDGEWEKIQKSREAGEGKQLPHLGEQVIIHPDQLAYIIYTSGSTGKPKGVMVEHHSLVNHALNFSKLTNLSPGDRVLQFLSLGFDASGEEIFPTLISGATLVLSPAMRELTTNDFNELVNRQSISMLHLPVAFWHHYVDDLIENNLSIPNSIRVLVVGGESPSIEKLRIWKERMQASRGEIERDCLFVNAYGPTEAAIATSYFLLPIFSHKDHPEDLLMQLERLPIGRPIANAQIYIVDKANQPTPIGVPGEILIGGAGVARGYLNQPGLTDEKFIPNFFNTLDILTSGNRLYRTGDMGWFKPDGNIEFVGRFDQQIKLRGFRIELGEIEAVLNEHSLVETCAVLLREDIPGNKTLVAYVVPTGEVVIRSKTIEITNLEPGVVFKDGELSGADDSKSRRQIEVVDYVDQLRNHLSNLLPDYMVPGIIIVVEKMPITPSGKIDRRSLPSPDHSIEQARDTYVAPRNDVEALIAGVWEQVLNIKHVGALDNFFNLGGHSLLATQVISRLRNIFNVDIPIRELFETVNLAELALKVSQLLKENEGFFEEEADKILPIPREPDTGIPLESPELSFSQQRLWFLDQLSPGNLFYNIPLAVEINGDLDPLALKKTLNEIIERHAVLRTNFASLVGKPVQVIHQEYKLSLPVEDLTYLSEDLRQQEALRLAKQEAKYPFNLEKDSLIRARLLLLDRERFVFLLTMHHIISDGWSMGIFMNELATLYPVYANGKSSPLPPLRIQYFDFASWQRKWMQGEQLERQLNYWRRQLANQPGILNLPTDRPRPAIQTSQGRTKAFILPLDLMERLNLLSREEGVTLYMTLLAAFQILLSRYSGQEDISVGTAIANRNRAEIEPLIGFFVNTLVMRTDLSGKPSFKELLRRVREVTLGAYAHQDLPFEMLVEELQPQRDLSHTPLFQVAFALQNAPTSDVIRTLGKSSDTNLSFDLLEIDSGSSKFDITLTLAETPGGLQGGLEYNTDLFDEDTIERMIAHYHRLLDGIIANPGSQIVDLPMISEAEKKMILIDWNQTRKVTPVDRCAHELFEAHAKKLPQNIAVIFENQQVTYEELDRMADQLAAYLVSFDIQPNQLVGISTDRSIEMIVGILGVMKAGGAYVPIDPGYPPERLAYMVTDSKIPVLLTQKHLTTQWKEIGVSYDIKFKELVKTGDNNKGYDQDVEDEGREKIPDVDNEGSKTAPILIYLDADIDEHGYQSSQPSDEYLINTEQRKANPDDLAYVIYTSGSTGRPKGTILRHRGLCNLAEAQREAFGITKDSRVLQFSPLSFDASVWETFMALANGATLVLARQETLASATDLLDLLKRKEVNIVTLPPSVLRLFKPGEVSRNALPALQTVVSAGEACSADIVQIWAPGRDFVNAYGPTETTVCASMYPCEPDIKHTPPIGKPITNTKLFLLDKYLQPVPIGVPGELHVSGVSLAVGYLNQPEMTSQKFIENPFVEYLQAHRRIDDDALDSVDRKHLAIIDNFDRLYKTGDLVRYLRDGNIEFLGRIDQQVKVRGFRIELGEIETALSNHPSVKEAVVIDQDSGDSDKRIVAFAVQKDGIEIELSELREFLRTLLPEYMVPAAFVILESFPLTPSGKIDRNALAAVKAFDRSTLRVEYVAPRNDIEQHLAEIVEDLLHIENVGINDNFFELGGHSLLATQFVSRVREELQVEISLRKLFETPTVAGIAEIIHLEQEIAYQQSISSEDSSTEGVQQAQKQKTAKSLDRARLAELLQRIGELSEEEVKELLEQKKALTKGD